MNKSKTWFIWLIIKDDIGKNHTHMWYVGKNDHYI